MLQLAIANKPSTLNIHRYPLQIVDTHIDTHSKSHWQPFAFLRTDNPSHSLPSPKPNLTVATVRSLQITMVRSLQITTVLSIHRRQNPASNRDGSHYLLCFRPHHCRYGSLASACDGQVTSAHDGSIYSPLPKPSINSRWFALSAMLPTSPSLIHFARISSRRFSLSATHLATLQSIHRYFFFLTSSLVYEIDFISSFF